MCWQRGSRWNRLIDCLTLFPLNKILFQTTLSSYQSLPFVTVRGRNNIVQWSGYLNILTSWVLSTFAFAFACLGNVSLNIIEELVWPSVACIPLVLPLSIHYIFSTLLLVITNKMYSTSFSPAIATSHSCVSSFISDEQLPSPAYIMHSRYPQQKLVSMTGED